MSTLNTVKNLFLSTMFVLNIAFTQDVSIGVGDVSFPGYTDDLVVPITVTNPNNSVGGIQFDVNVAPSMVMLSGVSAYGTAESNFNADYSILNNGNARVVFYDANGSSGLSPNSDDHVMNLHFSGSEILSAVLEVEIGNVVVSDNDGAILTSMPASGSLTIGDVIYMSGSTSTADDFNVTTSSGAESVSSAALTVDLSAASSQDVTVDYAVTGTATGSGTDYTLANGTLTISAGSTSGTITVASIIDDTADEDNETVILTLSSPSNTTNHKKPLPLRAEITIKLKKILIN